MRNFFVEEKVSEQKEFQDFCIQRKVFQEIYSGKS